MDNFGKILTHTEVKALIKACQMHLSIPTDDIRAHNAEIWREQRKELEENDMPMSEQPRSVRVGYVYLMRDASGLTKIGFSKNPKTRESTLQSEKPSIELVCAWPGTLDDERELHRRFAPKRTRGEWFMLGPSDLDDITAFMLKAF